MLKHFRRKFLKYLLLAIATGVVIASLISVIGAIFGAAGVLAGGAGAGVSAMWLPIAEGLAGMANAIGIGSAVSTVASGVGITGLTSFGSAVIAGASVIIAGIGSLVTGVAFRVASKKEVNANKYALQKAPQTVHKPTLSESQSEQHTVQHTVEKPQAPQATRSSEQDYYKQEFIPEQAKGGFAEKVRPEKTTQLQQTNDANKDKIAEFTSPSVSKAEKLLMSRAQNHGSSTGITA